MGGNSKFDDASGDAAEGLEGPGSELKIWYGDDATEGEFPFMVKIK